MAIMRVKKTEKFTTISNVHLNDTRLTWKATAILTYLLSKPNDWTVYVQQLAKAKKCGIKAVYTGIKELKSLGYIEHVYIRGEGGKVQHGEYIVHEEPVKAETPAEPDPAPHAQNRHAVKGDAVNGTLLNTDVSQKTDGDEQPPAVAPLDDLLKLIDEIPAEKQSPQVEKKLHKAVQAGRTLAYLQTAIAYTLAKSNGNFAAYLGKTIENGWADGFQAEMAKEEAKAEAEQETWGRMPEKDLQILAAAGNSMARKEIKRRAM